MYKDFTNCSPELVAGIKWGSSCGAASKHPFEEQRIELSVTPVIAHQLNSKTSLHLLHLQVRHHLSPHRGWQEHHREICIGTDLQGEKKLFLIVKGQSSRSTS